MTSGRQIGLALVLALLGITAGVALERLLSTRAEPVEEDYRVATVFPAPRPLPEFRLTGGDGEAFTATNLEGEWTLLFFGFTNCPDVCPATLATLAEVRRDLLSRNAVAPRVVFVSIDTLRDDPAAAESYARHFDASFKAAGGSDAELRALTTPLGIVHLAEVREDGDYLVDHSTALLLVNPQAQWQAVFSAPHRARDIADDLARLAAR